MNTSIEPSEFATAKLPDTSRWPDAETFDDCSPWWDSMGEGGRDEYVAAFKDIRSAEASKDGSLVTPSRTFRFWYNAPASRPGLTRIDWVSLDGETYSFAFEYDHELRLLSASDPLAAAIDISDRFSLVAHRPDETAPYCSELHALAVRSYFLSDGRSSKVDVSWLSDKGRFKIETGAGEVFETTTLALPIYYLFAFPLEGARTDKYLFMGETGKSFELTIDAAVYAYTPTALGLLADEANAHLKHFDYPEIPPVSITRVSRRGAFNPSGSLLKAAKSKPGRIIRGHYDEECEPDLPLRMKPAQSRACKHLAELTHIEGGIIYTPHQNYEIRPDSERPASPYRKEIYLPGAEFPILGFGGELDFEDIPRLTETLRSLQARSVNHVSKVEITERANLMTVISQATIEILISRLAAAGDPDISPPPIYVNSQPAGIRINIGEGGARDAVLFPASPFYGNQDGMESYYIGGHFLSSRPYIPSVSGILANEMFASAQRTFSEVGISDIQPLVDAIDKTIQCFMGNCTHE
ncbi:hypothetical protein [Erythrobacter aureus]|uniref:Uncharacterized protein n=1 Tax=Erythrobacter aureus TaxID=2182384 RepID=A0A345YJD9_9SPHN|nr:hypothetical protein [Erythrobacter aureus]AXK44041.1 hypothetical protein DVR09_16440 [Erythrobacter aureus]